MSLWGAFTGSDARRYAENARNQNRNQLNQGYDNNRGYQQQGYQSAVNRLSPYEMMGRQGQTAYTNLLGLNGGDAQRGARQGYEGWNPYLGDEMSLADRSIQRRSAATGQLDSGMNALARQRAAMEMGSRDFYNYNDRLQGLGQQGYGAANALAGLDMGNAQSLIGIENALRGGNIQNETQYWNAQSQANQGLMNNIFGLGGMAIQGLNAFRGFGGGANSNTGQVPIGQSQMSGGGGAWNPITSGWW